VKLKKFCSENTEPQVETIENPVKDHAQDAWLKLFEYRRRNNQPIPNASTAEELDALYGEDGGLVANMYKQVEIDKARRNVLMAFESFDLGDDEPLIDLLIDHDAEIPFHKVETLGIFTELLNESTPVVRQALLRFAAAWALYDVGVTLPKEVMRRIDKDRRLTGLPLRLRT
jgi:hypothetical protein